MLVDRVDKLSELDIALGQALDIVGSQGDLDAVVDLMCRRFQEVYSVKGFLILQVL